MRCETFFGLVVLTVWFSSSFRHAQEDDYNTSEGRLSDGEETGDEGTLRDDEGDEEVEEEEEHDEGEEDEDERYI